MKFKELKMRFKNKYMIRIVAGILTVALLGTSVGAYNVYAKKSGEAEAFPEETEENNADAKEDAEELLTGIFKKEGASFGQSGDETGKDETVYIIAGCDGTAKTTIVSEWLKNPDKKDTLEDASDLSDIKNVKGEEEFKRNGSNLSWDAGGNDIYYQGTSTKEAPVTEKITYYLDGKEIAAKELAGKSGKVKIRFDYTNHEKSGGVYVPFMTVSGMLLDDNFTNIQVENGKVISNGERNLVVGVAMPGLKESLQVEDEDFSDDVSIPDYVEVTADVEDFSLDMTMTVVTGISELASDTSIDLSEMDEKIDDLTSAMGQLKDGSKELSDGLFTMHEKMGEFSDGTDTLQNGITAYTDGAKKLADGIGTLKGQTGVLISGISDLVSSVGTLNEGVKTLDKALNAPMGEKEKAGAAAAAKTAAESAVDAQFADDSNPQSYNNIKAQASQAFYASVATDAAKQAAAAAARQQAAAGIQAQKPAIVAQAKEQAAAGIQAQKPAIAAQAKEQAIAAIGGQMDTIAAQAKEQAVAAAAGAVSDETKAQLKAAFTAAGYVQAAQAAGIPVEDAMKNDAILAQVEQAAQTQLQTLLGTVGTAAGNVADQTARGVASNVAGSVAEQAAGSIAEQVAGSVAEQVAGGVAEQVAGSVAEQVAPQVVESVAGQAKDAVGTSLADSVKQGAKTAAGQAASQAAVAGAESAKKQIAANIEKKDAKTGYSLVSGMGALNEGVNGMSGKMPKLTEGIDQLYDGSQTLASKNNELNNGTAKLKDGKDQLADGVLKLRDGSKELSDGLIEFDEEGIEKLVDSYNGDIKDFTNRLQEVLDAGKAYESFGGKAHNAAGNVKFIIKTEEIKTEK